MRINKNSRKAQIERNLKTAMNATLTEKEKEFILSVDLQNQFRELTGKQFRILAEIAYRAKRRALRDGYKA